jgi:hypothetical protein
MAHALALDDRESVGDDVTALTVTDMLFVSAVVEEYEEDVADQATVTELRPADEAPIERAARLRARRAAVVDVRLSDVPDPASADLGSRPAPDLELLVLQQDNLRLQRELETARREVNALNSSIDSARRVARESTDHADIWRRVSRETESALSCLAQERDHYKAYAMGGLMDRLRSCPRFEDVVDSD